MNQFELLSAAERADVRNQGDMSLYSDDNLARRAQLRTNKHIEKMLEKWWVAVCIWQDEDNSKTLSKEEYAEFYKRLCESAWLSMPPPLLVLLPIWVTLLSSSRSTPKTS